MEIKIIQEPPATRKVIDNLGWSNVFSVIFDFDSVAVALVRGSRFHRQIDFGGPRLYTPMVDGWQTPALTIAELLTGKLSQKRFIDEGLVFVRGRPPGNAVDALVR